MWKTVVRRILIMIPQLIALSLFAFILAEFMPGDPLTGIMADTPGLTPERIAEIRAIHGLDDPWPVRYGRWIRGMFRGDFGLSLQFQLPILEVVGPRLVNTLRLSFLALIILYGISVPFGILAGRYNGKTVEKLISGYVYFGMAMPAIVLSFFLIWFFGFILGWFPMSGTWSVEAELQGGIAVFLSQIHHMILPALAMSLTGSVGIVQFLKSEIVDSRESDYVLTIRSKGAPAGVIYNKHILRNSILPMVNGIGFAVTGLLSGTVIIERIFGYNGMGRLFIDLIVLRDFSIVIFLIVFYGFLAVIGGLISDIALMLFDPRIRIE